MCLTNRKEMNITDFVFKAIETFDNYEEVKRGLKNN